MTKYVVFRANLLVLGVLVAILALVGSVTWDRFNAARSARPNEITVRSPAATAWADEKIRAAPSHQAPLLLRSFNKVSVAASLDFVGNFLGFAGQLHDVEAAADPVTAVAIAAIVHIRVVA